MLGADACSTITVICSTFKRVLSPIGIDAASVVSRLECIRVHFVQVSVSRPEVQGLGLGLETQEKVLTTTLVKISICVPYFVKFGRFAAQILRYPS